MDYLKAVQKGIDFVESRLHTNFSLYEVSQAADLSQWHFQRIFKALTNETLKTYIRTRRLSQAQESLLNTDERILEIALDSGFESQESFSRAFKKAFQETPNRFRRKGKAGPFPRKIRMDTDYLRHLNSHLSLVPEIRIQGAMRLVGKRTLYYGSDSEKNNMADKLPKLWDSFLGDLSQIEHIIDGVGYGLIGQTPGERAELEYHAAVEVEKPGQLAPDMVDVNFAAQKMAVFRHKGPVKNLDLTVNYIYSNWLLTSSQHHTLGPDLEIYGPEYHPTSMSEMS